MEFDFEEMKPEDGFDAFIVGDELRFSLTYKGQPVFEQVVADQDCFADVGPFAASRLERTHLVLKAVAEFMNAGGSMAELHDFVWAALRLVSQELKTKKYDEPVLDFGRYEYLQGDVNDRDRYVFLDAESGQVVEWDRSLYIDRSLTIEDFPELSFNGTSTNTVDIHREDFIEKGQADSSPDLLPGPPDNAG